MVRCYVCDRLTGLSSIAFHHTQCAQAFRSRNHGPSVPPLLRRALAEPPSTALPDPAAAASAATREEEAAAWAAQVSAYSAAARQVHRNEVRGAV